jgi:uncharacterized phage-like protein YoqJ
MIIGVTGHRMQRLGGYGEVQENKLFEFVCKEFEHLGKTFNIQMGDSIEFMIGMALGWDTAVARACIKFNIPFIAAIPFRGQEQFWPLHARIKYQALLSAAKDTVVVCPGAYSADAMDQRNRYIVNRSDVMFAMFDGDQSGGTYNAIQFAEYKGLDIYNAWNSWNG